MAAPANLYPGLNDISDVLEEVPLDVSRYMTLLYEIDAKCVNIIPELNKCIKGFLGGRNVSDESKVPLRVINQWFQELIPSLEEKMHVSSIAYDSLERLTDRLELAYEVAISNQEIPEKLRLGNDNHPAMHLHRELMAKVESNVMTKSQQALKSESRREAMAAKKTTGGTAVQGGNAAGTANSGSVGSTTGSTSTSGTGASTAVAGSESLVATVGSHGNAPNHGANAQTNGHNRSSTMTGHKSGNAHNHNHNDNSHSHADDLQPANSKKRRNNNGTTTVSTPSTNNNNSSANSTAAQRRNKKRVNTAAANNGVTGSNTTAVNTANASNKYQNRPKINEYGEALYCYCNQVAYGEMVGCDGENCQLEWFHLPCIGLETLPKGKWYCDDCLNKN
ncbi:Pho23 [Kluyveromyces lactis]|nr:Pho23 [Kluyveromyces lactis]